jgi:hypothetical protein
VMSARIFGAVGAACGAAAGGVACGESGAGPTATSVAAVEGLGESEILATGFAE